MEITTLSGEQKTISIQRKSEIIYIYRKIGRFEYFIYIYITSKLRKGDKANIHIWLYTQQNIFPPPHLSRIRQRKNFDKQRCNLNVILKSTLKHFLLRALQISSRKWLNHADLLHLARRQCLHRGKVYNTGGKRNTHTVNEMGLMQRTMKTFFSLLYISFILLLR